MTALTWGQCGPTPTASMCGRERSVLTHSASSCQSFYSGSRLLGEA